MQNYLDSVIVVGVPTFIVVGSDIGDSKIENTCKYYFDFQ